MEKLSIFKAILLGLLHALTGLMPLSNDAHALLLEGEAQGGPLSIRVLCVPYDNREAAEVADLYPDLPMKDSFQKEVLTGVYSR